MEELIKILEIEDETVIAKLAALVRAGMDMEKIEKLAHEEGSLAGLLKEPEHYSEFKIPKGTGLADIALHNYHSAEIIPGKDSDDVEDDFDAFAGELDTDYPGQDLVAAYSTNGDIVYFEPKKPEGWKDWQDAGMPELTLYAKQKHGKPNKKSVEAMMEVATNLGYNRFEIPDLETDKEYYKTIIRYKPYDQIHARPATQLFGILEEHQGKVRLKKGAAEANARSAIEILILAIDDEEEFEMLFEKEPSSQILEKIETALKVKRLAYNGKRVEEVYN